jgi:hypothetical protein
MTSSARAIVAGTRHDHAAIRAARECRDGALDFADIAHVSRRSSV